MTATKPQPQHDYELTMALSTLRHLGISLYSNIPAVVSEVVANSWDADAEEVKIILDTKKKTITIEDDGYGMTKKEINEKYLKVGYPKRENESVITPKGRHVMGRKGIGKLSLFSIANTIEVHSVKIGKNGDIIEKNGFIMDAKTIERVIKNKTGESTYYPPPVNKNKIKIIKGTKIVLRDLKKGMKMTERFLRTRLARRFSVIGQENDFSVLVNSKAIKLADRDYYKSIQYLWYIGENSKKYVEYCKKSLRQIKVDGIVDAKNGYKVSGWIGTFDEQKSIEEGNNTIVIQAWGKLIHEDILKDVKEGGVFTKYLIGEIRADFLDSDEKEDIATSDRQSLKENDPRFIKLKEYIQTKVLKDIQSKWRDWRNEDGTKQALETYPKLNEWFDRLSSDNRKHAQKLFGTINKLAIPDANAKKEIYKYGILAFESLALKGNLDALNAVETTDDFDVLKSIFVSMDQLEAWHYYQITQGRIEVLEKLQQIAPTAKERALQEHVFDHLWLLDPSWERAETDAWMEERVETEFGKVKVLDEDERKGRLDIHYREAAGKHIIIELKKYDRSVTATELINQTEKYRSALEKCLKQKEPGKEQEIEIICLLGSRPKPENRDKQNRDAMAAYGIRYILYDELITRTRKIYHDYLNKQSEVAKLQRLLNSF